MKSGLLLNPLSHSPSSLSAGERICKGHAFQKVPFAGERISRGHNFQKVSLAGSYGSQARKCNTWNLFKKFNLDCNLNNTQPRLTFQGRNNETCLVNAASQPPFESDHGVHNANNICNSIKNVADAFYQFIRPYAIMGTAMNVIATSLLAVEKFTDLNPLFFKGLLQAIIPAILMNIYIAGINNLTDIEIDKVNKPHLPMASGEFSFGSGVMIVTLFCAIGLCLGWVTGSKPLLWTLFISFAVGTSYSINLPLLRWKRHAVTSAMTWLTYQTALSIGYFLHMQTHVLGKPVVFPLSVMFAATIMSFFAVVITLSKDIPDIEGDKKFGIDSFTIRLGQKPVFWICISLLEMAYIGAILVGLMSPHLWSKVITVLGHGVIAVVLWARAKSVDLKSKAAQASFYMFVWKLYQAENLLIPFVR